MALVLRKAVLPKNVSLLKCFRGRHLATASGKKNPAALTTAVTCRSLRDKARTLHEGTVKIEKTRQLSSVRERDQSQTPPLLFSVSCPAIAPDSRTRYCTTPRHFSPPRTRSIYHDIPFAGHSFLSPHKSSSTPCLMQSNKFHTTSMYGFAKACTPPCGPCGPCPCGPCCNCGLPPPCNQPPKCIQYMTGYYYYPYGFWFCGPYHVTGTCTPVGPCSPGGPCGPSAPCPCAKCCACFSPVAPVTANVVSAVPIQSPRALSKPIQPTVKNDNVKFPLPPQDPKQSTTGTTPTQRSSISKFFPFNAVPPMQGVTRLHHTCALACPHVNSANNSASPSTHYSAPSVFPIHKPVYYTPGINQSNISYSTRPRQPFFNNDQKTKKSLPNSLSKSNLDFYEKRSETRSPIHHKRSKKKTYELSPILETPRLLMSQEQRDKPQVYPGMFQYGNIPNYRSPYPQTSNESNFAAYY